MNLLILDDEWYAVKGLSEGIDWAQAQIESVFEAFSSEQAKQIIRQNDIAVVICDIEMPEESGLVFASWLAQTYPLTQIIFLTGHADFDYARHALKVNAFDYILKPADHEVLRACVGRALEAVRAETQKNAFAECWKEYSEKLARDLPERTRRFWRNVIDNRFSRESMYARLAAYEITLGQQRTITPVALWVEEYGEAITASDEEIAALVLGEKLDQTLITQYGGCHIDEVGMDLLLLLYERPDDLEEQLQHALAQLGRHIGCRIAWKIGDAAPLETLWWAVYRMKSQMTEQKELPLDTIPIDWETMFIRRSAEQLHAQIDHMVGSMKNPTALRALCHKFCGAVLSLAADYGFSNRTMDLIGDAHTTATPEALADWMHRVTDACIQDIDTSLASRSAVIENVRRFIRANLDAELTREAIASHIYLHPVYLSRIFKQEMGVSLSEYITAERISAAKAMLRDPGIKVGSVATKVGYPQFSYFSRVFRKVTGMSPQEYQRSAEAGGE